MQKRERACPAYRQRRLDRARDKADIAALRAHVARIEGFMFRRIDLEAEALLQRIDAFRHRGVE